MFNLSKDKYTRICSSCGKHVTSPDDLIEISVRSSGENNNVSVTAGNFCKDCLRDLEQSIHEFLNEGKCKCGNPLCTGFYLLHPKEMGMLDDLMVQELKKNPKCSFKLMDSPPSGEIFTRFRELHVRSSNQ